MLVAVEQIARGQTQATQGFDGCAGVVYRIRAPYGMAVIIQRPAYIEGIVSTAGTENQRLLLVDQRAHTQVQALSRGDGGGLRFPSDSFFAVDQPLRLDGHVVAVDAAGADILDLRC